MGRRKMIKTAAALVALGYCSLLVYHGGVTFNTQESRPSVQVSIEPTKLFVNKSETVMNNSLILDDVFISVKTTKHYQFTRLPIILQTWFQLAKQQTWFFTDTDNKQHQLQTNGHMVNTNCSTTHHRKHLCCKMSVEYDHFIDSNKKWFCHFDDDNYVNVPRLVSMLQQYSHQEDWYLGRVSTDKPVKLFKKKAPKQLTFWFATGGAGFCISRSMALKMVSVASGGKFISMCEHIRLPDDVTVGFIIGYILKKNLTQVPEFHSHLEQMKLLPSETFKDQISFSYAKFENDWNNEWNVVNVPGFDTQYDPTRFLSLHCFLYPDFKFCPR